MDEEPKAPKLTPGARRRKVKTALTDLFRDGEQSEADLEEELKRIRGGLEDLDKELDQLIAEGPISKRRAR